jgi:hypothetical protein
MRDFKNDAEATWVVGGLVEQKTLRKTPFEGKTLAEGHALPHGHR